MPLVYLSSTYEDLKDYRRAVFEMLCKAGYRVIAMEEYVAMDERPVDRCLEDVQEADIYVGLFAFRYGYIPPSKHNNPRRLSITELELRQAQRFRKPCLTFLADPRRSRFPADFMDACTGDGEKGKRIERLRVELGRERMTNLFKTPYELANYVQASITLHLKRHAVFPSSSGPQSQITAAITWDIKRKGSPYPGLKHFTKDHASVFFGRDMEVGEILDRMREPEGRFLLISGASGSGKSSLVAAGVLPRIEVDGIAGDKKYKCVRMVPSRGGPPFASLLLALRPYTRDAGIAVSDLADQLVKGAKSLSRRIEDIITESLGSHGLVLFLDQMEELFADRDLRQSYTFLSRLCKAAQDAKDGRLQVIATIRNDFLHYCHQHRDLLHVLRGQGHYALGSIDRINEMISKPADCAGLKINERLVRRLVKEAGQSPDSLPLLAFALRQLFEKREGNELTERAFNQLGGLAGVIRCHATIVEDRIIKLLRTDSREVFSKLFAPLVEVTNYRRPTRRWVSRERFEADLRPAIDVLTQERLLTADEGQEHESLIAVAHETLFECWPTLAEWISINREDLVTLHRAEIEADEWERHDYALDYLWSIERLKELRGIIKRLGNKQVSDAVQLYAAPQGKLVELLDDGALAHKDRLRIGEYLNALGDPRCGIGIKDGLPDIVWIDIPAGVVRLNGINHEFNIRPFRMARYPVTNEQFAMFLKADDGYQRKKWWKDIEQSDHVRPGKWLEDNAPRETVSWYEAVAFCRWLSAKTQTGIRLPTEWEWQQAATGGDSTRKYSWKGGWYYLRCNSTKSRLNRTIAVGMYPQWATQQGLMDIVGNVWEWCLNTYESPARPEAVRICKCSGSLRVIRGGSWCHGPRVLRTSFRKGYSAADRLHDFGFRLVQDIS